MIIYIYNYDIFIIYIYTSCINILYVCIYIYYWLRVSLKMKPEALMITQSLSLHILLIILCFTIATRRPRVCPKALAHSR